MAAGSAGTSAGAHEVRRDFGITRILDARREQGKI